MIAGPQTPQGRAQLRVRGDDLNAALHVLEKPDQWLQVGDAVLLHDTDGETLSTSELTTGRHDTRVQAVRGDGVQIDGQWFEQGPSGSLVSGDGRIARSTTTVGGDHPYGQLGNEINAKLYLLGAEIEDWKATGTAPTPQVDKYEAIARHHVLQATDVESERWGEPGHLHGSARQLARRSNYLGGHLEAVQTVSRTQQLAQQQSAAPSARRTLTRRPPALRPPRRTVTVPEQPAAENDLSL